MRMTLQIWMSGTKPWTNICAKSDTTRLESINKYQDVDFSPYNDAIICLRASSEYPVSEDEKNRLLAGLPTSLKKLPIKIGIGIKETLKQEVEMMLFSNIIR